MTWDDLWMSIEHKDNASLGASQEKKIMTNIHDWPNDDTSCYSKIWSFEVVFWPYKIRHNSKFIGDLKLENVSAYWQDDEDVYILSKISDIVHALFGTKGADFLPVFDQLLELFVRLLKPDSPWPDRQWGICIFDDLLEYTGPVSVTDYYT